MKMMIISVLGLGSLAVVWGQGYDDSGFLGTEMYSTEDVISQGYEIPNRSEFFEFSKRMVSNSARLFTPHRTTCDSELRIRSQGQQGRPLIDCYAISTGPRDLAFSDPDSSPNGEAVKFHSSNLTLAEGKYWVTRALPGTSEYERKLRDVAEVDFMMMTMDQPPQCSIINEDLTPLTGPMIGPGAISITEQQFTKKTHGFRVGVSESFKTPLADILGGVTITFNEDYSRIYGNSILKSTGQKFYVGDQATCTPHHLQFAIACKEVRIRYTLSHRNQVIKSWVEDRSSDQNLFLVPFFKRNEGPFISIMGCIDESRA